jgi:hypothetical protein
VGGTVPPLSEDCMEARSSLTLSRIWVVVISIHGCHLVKLHPSRGPCEQWQGSSSVAK